MSKLNHARVLAILAGLAAPVVAHAGFVPFGVQAGVSTATATAWGWKECHRSPISALTPVQEILEACKGSHLMMGYASVSGRYEILGAGAYDTVGRITYANAGSDNHGTTLDNWSNGLNFYRTAGDGSWGFTTGAKTELNDADIFLLNGLQLQNGQLESEPVRGLSYMVRNGRLHFGWAYNTTGVDFTEIFNGQRVFLSLDPAEVPEPGTLLLLGIGLAGAGLARRRVA